ncbi:unnamed protein product [Ranitomeya imitator]|uniref:Uncharacterized protein n=1 Tax=Ranitomeya imitator TaxID=111125 RepID=A0ABN9L329_9NEOB|nr:unnamed protein product [Ranitomeya imitator]
MVVDDEEKANILNTFFSTVFTVENEMLGEIPRNNENPILRVTNLTQEEVRNRLNKIKIDKSLGPDGIHPRVLRELSNVIDKPLFLIFSDSIATGSVPQDWRIANVVPIFKKGSKSEPGNYRPHGFMRNRSCQTNLISFYEEVSYRLDHGESLDVVYLDFSKAFDTVPHKRWKLILYCGIHPKTECDIKNKWRTVLGKFIRELAREQRSTTAQSKRKPYIYRKEMMFLTASGEILQANVDADLHMREEEDQQKNGPVKGSARGKGSKRKSKKNSVVILPPRPPRMRKRRVVRSRAFISEQVDAGILTLLQRRASEDGLDDFGRVVAAQLFLKAHVNTTELADLLIQQNHIGSVIKQAEGMEESDDDDEEEDHVFGFISLLNLTERKCQPPSGSSIHPWSVSPNEWLGEKDFTGVPCAEQIKELILGHCEKSCEQSTVQQLEKILNDNSKPVGHLLSERFINVPAQIALPMHQQLQKELAEAQRTNKPCGKCYYYLIISKTFTEAAKKPQGSGTQGKEEMMFANAEEEFFYENATLKFNYSVQGECDTQLSGRWSFNDVPMKPLRTVMLVPADRMDSIMEKFKEYLSV